MSCVERLDIECTFFCEPNMDDTLWLENFRTFTALRTLYITSTIYEGFIVSALRALGRGVATEVLPALEDLYLSPYLWPDVERFITARKRSNHPVTVHRLNGPLHDGNNTQISVVNSMFY